MKNKVGTDLESLLDVEVWWKGDCTHKHLYMYMHVLVPFYKEEKFTGH